MAARGLAISNRNTVHQCLPDRTFVPSDIAPLRRAIVHRPGPEIFKVTVMSPGDHPVLPRDLIGDRAIQQHAAFVEILQNCGVDVLFVEDLLQEAIACSIAGGTFRPWLKAHLPSAYRTLARMQHPITGFGAEGALVATRSPIVQLASMLIGAEDDVFYRADRKGHLRPLVNPMKGMFYTRDFAVMTPRGAIVCNFIDHSRAFEGVLAKLMFDRARSLKRYPIAFDALSEEVYVQGGDAILADKDTLFLGVRNMTEQSAAPKLARKLGLDVLATALPSSTRFRRGSAGKHWTGLHLQFLHLDTVFTFVDTNKVLTLPYFFEAKYAGRDPLTRILEGLSNTSPADADPLRAVIGTLKDVGWVTRYKAGSGTIDRDVRGMKLVDYLRQTHHQVIYVGGAGGDVSDFKYVMEHVLRELRFQAANVLAVEPGKVIAYEGNRHTLAALKAAGIRVVTFPAYELVRSNGGPHCMAMPLERAVRG